MSIYDTEIKASEILGMIDKHFSELRSAVIEQPDSPSVSAWASQLNVVAELKLDMVNLIISKHVKEST